MKKLSVILAASAAIAVQAANEQGIPSVGNAVISSALPKASFQTGSHPIKNVLASGQPGVVGIRAILMTSFNSASWPAAADNVVYAVTNNTLNNTMALASPTGYALCEYRVGWQNLVYSVGPAHMWDGSLNPPPPFDQEYGEVVWQVVDARATSGLDELSLDMLSVTAVSSDSGNVLGGSVSFSGDSYTPRAIGIQADGTVITGGLASQLCARVIVLTSTPLFNVGGTQSGLDSVSLWVGGKYPFSIMYTAEIGGDSSTASSTMVSTAIPSLVVPRPILAAVPSGSSSLNISVANPANVQYELMGSSQASGPYTTLSGIINSNQSINLPANGSMGFFEAIAQ